MRLDRDLAKFFVYLDNKIGKGNYSVFLTADHGAINNVNFLLDHKASAGSLATEEWINKINSRLEQEYKVKNLALTYSNTQISLNNVAIAKNKFDESGIRSKVVDMLNQEEGVAYAFDIKDVSTVAIPEVYRAKVINCYNRERSGVIQVLPKPGWTEGGTVGTTHGSIAHYDTHIPLIFMGWGIKHGESKAAYTMSDIAPTITSLLKVQEPNGTVGKPITEVFK